MLAPSNICDIFLAFDVDIFPRSISPNLNEANIYEKSSTLAAFNPSTFSISELKNNLDIDLTESKLNPSIVIDFKFWQFSNVLTIEVNSAFFSVFIEIDVIAETSLNI